MDEERSQADEYREKIVEMIDRIEDLKFLRQIYTIIYQYMKRAETT